MSKRGLLVQPRVVVVDYGVGNRFSIIGGLRRAGATVTLSRRPEDIRNADGIVLPGVGSFPAAMRIMEEAGIVDLVVDAVKEGRPLLGICLGMQLLFEESVEWGGSRGLGLLPGRVVQLPTWRKPHMAWTRVWRVGDSKLLKSIDYGEYFYFAHSFYVDTRGEHVKGYAVHSGFRFPAVVEKHPVYGTQFHPEKSGHTGLKVLRNWFSVVEEAVRR
ncbi:imidazole glycerol phosphate synthase, glutamine amidotransferase subunit [Pyrolobus fumarii 1A]|uniref:Imidazole glycerol phosphate synthase subunit HisH n=1 Tax=Pyrolobus fumarii (strain DSM 11204 / 1A) TaxID=694429 RepID=G0EF03_PYRF1|nr:imidazole glycerol phosphate synthase subunit HisH [Pyrolobus fumarii]AEM38900.1 imidazole glycerol phosphate synthase, glutamine amidotransferase subunit [Pyrolobus fumarii 1A]